MRVFESDRFKDKYIEGLSGSSTYDYPDEESKQALNYVGQFVQRGSRELIKGYMPSKYADALVRLRDANGSRRKLKDGITALCVNGAVSSEASVSSLVRVDIPNSMEITQKLGDEYYEAESREARLMVRSAQEVIRNSRDEKVEIWLPSEVIDEVPTFQQNA